MKGARIDPAIRVGWLTTHLINGICAGFGSCGVCVLPRLPAPLGHWVAAVSCGPLYQHLPVGVEQHQKQEGGHGGS